MSRRFILLVPFICLALFVFGQKKDLSIIVEERIKQVEGNVPQGVYEIAGAPKQAILDRMKFHGVKGVSIAVINDYKVEWAKCYGWADSSEQRPVTPETFFQIGSI
ncbi:MAG: serine hydrolase [Bacteroidetes bacterium]|nr:serine hydrolase [Bacteroidota bacterium]